MKREQIVDLFTDPTKTMANGLWFSGIKDEGEYKRWHENGELWVYCFYKDGQLHGEYKRWHENGQLWIHTFFKDDKAEGEYRQWNENGQLWHHKLYKNGEVIKDYLK